MHAQIIKGINADDMLVHSINADVSLDEVWKIFW